MMKKLSPSLLACLLLLVGLVASAAAQPKAPSAAELARADIAKTLGFVPDFFKQFPDVAVAGVWQEMKGLQLNPSTALSGRVKELIGLAVAAQIPCRYCTYAHIEFAKLNGATQAELGEAIAIAGLERHASAYFYGLAIDPNNYRAELARIVENAKKAKPANNKPELPVVDAQSARADIERTFGFVPEFMRKLPDAALVGAWRELEDVKLNPSTSISVRDKALVSLAVASQVPSEACIAAETAFAKLAGATDREIAEAVGMAAITRNMSTLLNGLTVDEKTFKADVNRLVAGAKAAAKKAAQTSAQK